MDAPLARAAMLPDDDRIAGLDAVLLNEYQHGFPLTLRPFARIAEEQCATEDVVIQRYRGLRAAGRIGRIGAVFRPNTIGASMLAAMAVPRDRLDEVAAIVSASPAVNHNYEREHAVNLWFVAAAASAAQLSREVTALERATGHEVLRLPLLEPFHLDLGFDLNGPRDDRRHRAALANVTPIRLEAGERALVGVLQAGLPLTTEPYDAVGESCGMTGVEVLGALRRWLDQGVISRFGVIVRHLALGYRANAMAVWNVPDALAGAVGQALAGEPAVTLCYRRARSLPAWPYNLYCMVHGRERQAVTAQIADLNERLDLARFDHEVLFQVRAFKQTGARYVRDKVAA
jgi:DNA-binding Lrp family transcriptional regulator